MVLATAVPKWVCVENRGDDSNETTSISLVSNVSEKACFVDGHKCARYKFDTYMTTIVSEVFQKSFFKLKTNVKLFTYYSNLFISSNIFNIKYMVVSTSNMC